MISFSLIPYFLQIGDKLEIIKNLSCDILDIKDRDIDKGHKNVKGNISDNGKQKSKDNEKNIRKEKN
ncbi:hypothetical protein [Clostridium beijerinckii]|uniref:hypothetical protein n=1 Tax=Clostridium beijerinckii TaxID=1520 RepID=UPI000809B208|nr:hypothetical protein [Clostridium beijerinckii]OCA98675.1 hypothetical protein BGS1_11615 [Clostridium beijerinckii]